MSAALLLCLLASSSHADVDVATLRDLPVLDRGRIKPIDSLARETVRSVTGRSVFGELDESAEGQRIARKIDPLAMILAWQRSPGEWSDAPLLYTPHLELRARVGIPAAHQWIAPGALRSNREFIAWTGGLMSRQAKAEQAGELARLIPLEEAAVLLRHRLMTFDAMADGRLVAIVPAKLDDPEHGWKDLATLHAPDASASDARLAAGWHDLLDAFGKPDQGAFDLAVKSLRGEIDPVLAQAKADVSAVGLEVAYNRLRPFRLVWIGYFFAVSLLVAGALSRVNGVYRIAVGALALCVLGHVAAFVLRCRITGWAPVTNMYETVVWVSLVAATIALAFELIWKSRVPALAGAITALIASIVADVMPPEMGGAFGSLAPVLRSNYWLTIHVLTIVSSYAAFALACVLGNIGVWKMAVGRSPASHHVTMAYRAIQVGVLLIAAGTILGGFWADVSWGRFWGWDPKEVWALIVLLVYLALLHGRFAGWVGPFGVLALSVVCFTTVLMSWYGVNFVLGAGLHSYGFGTGGQGYVGLYVLLQLLYVGTMWLLRRRHLPGPAAAPRGGSAVNAEGLPT